MKRSFLILVSTILLLTAVVFLFLKTNLTPFSSDSKNRVFIIHSGEGLTNISKRLEEDQLIKNNLSFIVYSFLIGQNSDIQAGTYRLSPSLTTSEIVKKLTTGGISDYWLRIPDGSRLEEVALLFPDNPYFTSQDFLRENKNKEGYLFPDSYLIPEYFNLKQILSVVSDNFDQKFSKAKEKSNSKLSDRNNLILASLLEREGRSLKSKQMIAGILLNRLNINMALQLDATVQYARDNQVKNLVKYWEPIVKNDLRIESPFNTYKSPGLPPRPICNPGYDSLYAVFHPIDSDYLYYITGNNSQMYYAENLDGHNQNIQKYLK